MREETLVGCSGGTGGPVGALAPSNLENFCIYTWFFMLKSLQTRQIYLLGPLQVIWYSIFLHWPPSNYFPASASGWVLGGSELGWSARTIGGGPVTVHRTTET
jgi:hypothetical protein